jgi:glycerol-3-phosphate O-acyltransferase / dihydroxyacetone phosphate acyltransferase
MEAGRRISFLIAEKSMRRRFVGGMSSMVGAVSVGRALDMVKPVPGKVYLPDPVNDPTLLRGVDTNFERSPFQVGGLIVLPSVNNRAANAEILEIHGPEEIRLKKPFKGAVAMKQLTGREDINKDGEFTNVGPDATTGPAEGYPGISFKVAPKVDQTAVYNAVFNKLIGGGCIGIFPEGGSHDRTELLPLKGKIKRGILGYCD